LRAATLEELALDRALQRLVAEFSESTRVPVQLSLELPEQTSLAPELAQALYRSAQEGLTNVHRHARATHVCLELRTAYEHVVLTIQDDGVGPAAANGHAPTSGFGLVGLRERVALLDGQLSFEAAAGGGSRLQVVLPLRPPRA
jgi:signal transduction histidine kinase